MTWIKSQDLYHSTSPSMSSSSTRRLLTRTGNEIGKVHSDRQHRIKTGRDSESKYTSTTSLLG